MVDQELADLLLLTRTKLQAGKLPITSAVKVWGGQGNGSPCDVCEQPILPTDIEYETEMSGARTYRFHSRCLGLWHEERARFLELLS
jgi:hypothetical protein